MSDYAVFLVVSNTLCQKRQCEQESKIKSDMVSPARMINQILRAGLPCLLLIFLLSACGDAPSQHNHEPSLIPEPQSLRWTGKPFSLNTCRAVVIRDTALRQKAVKWLGEIGLGKIPLRQSFDQKKENCIQLILDAVEAPFGQQEAYHLTVDDRSVILRAGTAHGIFNGLQTLFQLTSNGYVQGCDITDYPAYAWRGYMVDVGRNYQSVAQLKQQIDVMARYKLNVFHLHLTENVAWRLYIKQYPQLTAANNMTRNKGSYYSTADMKELIRYCKDRCITLVPEVDMPGHSAAFSRAMGVDMQDDSGLAIMKNIVRELCQTYDIPYIHVGADEVAIKNKKFLPEILALLHQYHKKTIAWDPGGNYGPGTIRQSWKTIEREKSAKYIDSRSLYLSDMAPESSVVTIFERQLGQQTHGDSNVLGAEICLWDDRRVAKQTDHLTMNAVYPDMLAFGERSWKGGGYPGVVLDIGPDTSARAKAFADFERRMIDHKRKYFTDLPFPYVKQQHIRWKLFGPFENQGDLSATFWPEDSDVSLIDSVGEVQATGGTIWLWYDNGHPYHSWLPAPRIHTTWYAYSEFWSDSDTTRAMWIGFKNILRSLGSATPPKGAWDNKASKIWINGVAVPAPKWKYPGRNLNDDLEAPLVDEGYYYRPPVRIHSKKGWNKILVKLPIKMDENINPWQRRCMFSVMPVRKIQGENWYIDDVSFRINKQTKIN